MTTKKTAQKKADEFLKVSSNFKLGTLPTESFHPLTKNLSTLSNTALHQAINILKKIDINILDVLVKNESKLLTLRKEIESTLDSGSRIFLCGCGSTGRLSLALETFWNDFTKHGVKENQIISLMSGGDTAIIKAIEKFEDHPQYAKRQLEELNFGNNDLLIASTEGGETPFVIGAVEFACKISERSPFFLYCNPDKNLMTIKRSKKILTNKKISKINLFTGPMAISGSTRMQASTIIMLAIGLALFKKDHFDIVKSIDDFKNFLQEKSFDFMADFIIYESDVYLSKNFILYETNEYGITILTDTSERAPTFSLYPYENKFDKSILPSLSYLSIIDTKTPHEAWRKLLKREPRPLNWKEFNLTIQNYLYGFDFSSRAKENRQQIIKDSKQCIFKILRQNQKIIFSLENNYFELSTKGLTPFLEQVLLKILLNIHSTLIMGRLGRYWGNVMTYVNPSNNKLIDRSIRYIMYLLMNNKIDKFSYNEIVYKLFEIMETSQKDQPTVLKTYEALLADLK